jgi:hypothetical protein
MNAPVHIAAERRVPDPRYASDVRRLDQAIAALQAARNAALAGTLFADFDGAVALQATRALWQSDDLDTLYGEIWSAAGASFTEDEVDAAVRGGRIAA